MTNTNTATATATATAALPDSTLRGSVSVHRAITERIRLVSLHVQADGGEDVLAVLTTRQALQLIEDLSAALRSVN